MTDQYSSDLEKQNEELQQRLSAAEERIDYLDRRIKFWLEPYCKRWQTIVHVVPSMKSSSFCAIRQATYTKILPDTIPYIMRKLTPKRYSFHDIDIMCTFCDSHVWNLNFYAPKDDMWKLEVHAGRLKTKQYPARSWRAWVKHFNDRAANRGFERVK